VEEKGKPMRKFLVILIVLTVLVVLLKGNDLEKNKIMPKKLVYAELPVDYPLELEELFIFYWDTVKMMDNWELRGHKISKMLNANFDSLDANRKIRLCYLIWLAGNVIPEYYNEYKFINRAPSSYERYNLYSLEDLDRLSIYPPRQRAFVKESIRRKAPLPGIETIENKIEGSLHLYTDEFQSTFYPRFSQIWVRGKVISVEYENQESSKRKSDCYLEVSITEAFGGEFIEEDIYLKVDMIHGKYIIQEGKEYLFKMSFYHTGSISKPYEPERFTKNYLWFRSASRGVWKIEDEKTKRCNSIVYGAYGEELSERVDGNEPEEYIDVRNYFESDLDILKGGLLVKDDILNEREMIESYYFNHDFELVRLTHTEGEDSGTLSLAIRTLPDTDILDVRAFSGIDSLNMYPLPQKQLLGVSAAGDYFLTLNAEGQFVLYKKDWEIDKLLEKEMGDFEYLADSGSVIFLDKRKNRLEIVDAEGKKRSLPKLHKGKETKYQYFWGNGRLQACIAENTERDTKICFFKEDMSLLKEITPWVSMRGFRGGVSGNYFVYMSYDYYRFYIHVCQNGEDILKFDGKLISTEFSSEGSMLVICLEIDHVQKCYLIDLAKGYMLARSGRFRDNSIADKGYPFLAYRENEVIRVINYESGEIVFEESEIKGNSALTSETVFQLSGNGKEISLFKGRRFEKYRIIPGNTPRPLRKRDTRLRQ
jgi:hypothetical protein